MDCRASLAMTLRVRNMRFQNSDKQAKNPDKRVNCACGTHHGRPQGSPLQMPFMPKIILPKSFILKILIQFFYIPL
jgi:hypothetical protein